MYKYFLDGGMTMIFLFILSVLGFGSIMDRAFYFFKNEKDINGDFKDKIIKLVRDGQDDKAIELCENTNNSISRTIKNILLAYEYEDDMYESKEKLMKEKALDQIENLEKRLTLLAIVAYISPMTGLLGTVLGMIKSFKAIALQGTGDPNVVANGISEALLTTATGLIIAIPAIIAYNLFNRRIDKIMLKIEKTATALINIKKKKEEGR